MPELRWNVYRVRKDARTLVAAFVDYDEAEQFAAEFLNGDFTGYVITDNREEKVH